MIVYQKINHLKWFLCGDGRNRTAVLIVSYIKSFTSFSGLLWTPVKSNDVFESLIATEWKLVFSQPIHKGGSPDMTPLIPLSEIKEWWEVDYATAIYWYSLPIIEFWFVKSESYLLALYVKNLPVETSHPLKLLRLDQE